VVVVDTARDNSAHAVVVAGGVVVVTVAVVIPVEVAVLVDQYTPCIPTMA